MSHNPWYVVNKVSLLQILNRILWAKKDELNFSTLSINIFFDNSAECVFINTFFDYAAECVSIHVFFDNAAECVVHVRATAVVSFRAVSVADRRYGRPGCLRILPAPRRSCSRPSGVLRSAVSGVSRAAGRPGMSGRHCCQGDGWRPLPRDHRHMSEGERW